MRRLRSRGVDIQYINVGGGLGVNYEAGEVTAPHGINYTLRGIHERRRVFGEGNLRRREGSAPDSRFRERPRAHGASLRPHR